MNFDLIQEMDALDADGNPIKTNETIPLRAEFEGGTLKIFNANDELLVLQPWKPEVDGSRGTFADIEDAVAWYKTDNNHQGA